VGAAEPVHGVAVQLSCGVALVQFSQAGLPQKTIDDINWINDRICALPVKDKNEMWDQFWYAWQRYNIKGIMCVCIK
jgi:hypothetical protein